MEEFKKVIKKIGEILIFYYPFTLTGTLLLGAGFYLLGSAVAAGNPYGFLFGIIIFLALIILGALSRYQAWHLRKDKMAWNTTESPVVAQSGYSYHTARLTGSKPFYFFRTHLILKGKLKVGPDQYFRYSNELSSPDGKHIKIPLCFPMTGILHVRGRLRVKDIFGLTRGAVAGDYDRQIIVEPPFLEQSTTKPVIAAHGSEDEHKFQNADIERYYMRDYVPGDKVRDINWKASGRFFELFTRISPVNENRTKIIRMVMRPYKHRDKHSYEALLHLNYIKSWALSFVREIYSENHNYMFEVSIGEKTITVKSDEDLPALASALGSMFFTPEGEDTQGIPEKGNVFVFTTMYDRDLQSVMNQYQKTRFNIFSTIKAGSDGSKIQEEFLFPSYQKELIPGRWVLYKEPAPKGNRYVNSEIGMLEIHRIKTGLVKGMELW